MKQTKPSDSRAVLSAYKQTQKSGTKLLTTLQQRDNLPDTWLQDALLWYLPLAAHLASINAQNESVFCIGINGAQGTGKSTLAEALRLILTHDHHLRTVTLSLDDFYLSRMARMQLAGDTHPLLQTRGVPGTHNTALAAHVIRSLKLRKAVHLPQFNKATDEPVPEHEWPLNKGGVDIVILEGWCVGLKPQTADALATPVNALECREDADGRWRGFVNHRLAGDYQLLFSEIDYLIMLKAPGLAQVIEWRALQEQKLAKAVSKDFCCAQGINSPDVKPRDFRLMDSAELERFIAHYERLTRHAFATLPDEADLVMILDEQHRIVAPPPVASVQPPE